MPWLRKCFLVGEILFKLRILRSSFLIGLFLIKVKRGAQDISLYTYACRPSHVEPVNFIPLVYCPSMPYDRSYLY